MALAALLVGCALLRGWLATTALPGVAATLVDRRTLALVGGVAPAAALVALTLGAIVSTRAKDARSAQQAGVVVVLPLVAVLVAQLNGQVTLEAGDLLVATVVAAGRRCRPGRRGRARFRPRAYSDAMDVIR